MSPFMAIRDHLNHGDQAEAIKLLLEIVTRQQRDIDDLKRSLRHVEGTADDALRRARRGF